jgi:flagellar motor switch protein FliG
MDTTHLPGALKVAVLINSMGEEVSRDILARMGDAEKKLIQQHMSQIDSISPEVVEKISQEFAMLVERMRQRNALGQILAETEDNDESQSEPLQVPEMPQESIPDESESESEYDPDTEPIEEESTLKALQSIDPDQLVEMIKDEHPQTIAVIVVHLKPESGIAVLSKLPDNLKVEVAMRIARLDKVLSGMINEIDRLFEELMKKKKTSATHKTGGVSHLAELLNMAEGSAGEHILSEIEELNPDLAAQIKQMMFVF